MSEQKHNWKKFWDRSGNDKSQISWSKKRILDVIAPYLKADQSILDAGCGSGFFSAYFCDRKLKTVSVDYCEEALSLTKEKTFSRSRIVMVDMLADNLEDKLKTKFDYIFTDGLFEHFSADKQDKIISNFASILNPQGLLMTFVPNRYSPWTLIRPFIMPEIEEKPFVIKELIDMNNRNSFEVILSGGVNVLPCKISPEKFMPQHIGMLIFTISRKKI